MLDRKSLEQIRMFNQEAPSRHARAMLKAAGESPEDHGLHLLQLLQWAIDNLGLDQQQTHDLQGLHDRLNLETHEGRPGLAYRFLTGDDGSGGMSTGLFESTNEPKEAARRLVRLSLPLIPT